MHVVSRPPWQAILLGICISSNYILHHIIHIVYNYKRNFYINIVHNYKRKDVKSMSRYLVCHSTPQHCWLSKGNIAYCTISRKNANGPRSLLTKGHNFSCNVLQAREAYWWEGFATTVTLQQACQWRLKKRIDQKPT